MQIFLDLLVWGISGFGVVTCVLIYFAFKRGWQGWGGYE